MKLYLLLVFALISSGYAFSQEGKVEKFRMILKDNWQMQSTMKDRTGGNIVSKPGYKSSGWYRVNVPTTIIGGLLANHEYNFDPFFGTNFEKLNDERLDHPWWFRRDFNLPATEKGKTVTIKLHGINYK